MNDHVHPSFIRSGPAPVLRAILILFASVLLLAACGGDDDTETSSDDTSAASDGESSTEEDTSRPDGDDEGGTEDDEGDNAAGGPITVETLADRCDAFTEAITSLRGEAPAWVEPSEVSNPSANGETYREADCHYAYDGDYLDDGDYDLDSEDISDKNRLSIRIKYADGMTPAQKEQMWNVMSTTEPVTGLGDEGQWHSSDAIDIDASARVLTGDTVVVLRASVPEELDGAAWIAKDPMVAALKEILTIIEG